MTLSLRLTLTTGAVVACSLIGFSLGLYAAVTRAAWKQFDERLANDANAFAKMVEEQPTSPWEFEPGVPEEFDRENEPAYFELRMEDGTLLGASRALHGKSLKAGDSVLPDGRPGRGYAAVLPPRPDAEHPVSPSGHGVRVVIARSTVEIEGAFAMLRWLLVAAGLTTLVLAALAGAFAVRRGLDPLTGLARSLDALSADKLYERLPTAALPAELRPPVARLNELLGRLQLSFTRERQFSADASHELRTPLAGMRSVLEVALAKNDRSAAEYTEALADAHAVALQMQQLVENLLLLSRVGAGQLELSHEALRLRPFIDACFEPLAERAAQRRLVFDNRVADGVVFSSDAATLRIVVGNLLRNAVDYTIEGGTVTVKSALPQGTVLAVDDSGPAIPPDALETIFDPFVRLDPSRSATGEHAGIGLSLVRTLCAALGLRVRVENLTSGHVTFLVER